jgi:hypothetical protein
MLKKYFKPTMKKEIWNTRKYRVNPFKNWCKLNIFKLGGKLFKKILFFVGYSRQAYAYNACHYVFSKSFRLFKNKKANFLFPILKNYIRMDLTTKSSTKNFGFLNKAGFSKVFFLTKF